MNSWAWTLRGQCQITKSGGLLYCNINALKPTELRVGVFGPVIAEFKTCVICYRLARQGTCGRGLKVSSPQLNAICRVASHM